MRKKTHLTLKEADSNSVGLISDRSQGRNEKEIIIKAEDDLQPPIYLKNIFWVRNNLVPTGFILNWIDQNENFECIFSKI